MGYNQETAFSFHAIGTFKQLRYAAGIVYILTETVNASIAVIRTTILFFLHSMAISQQKLFPFLNWIPRTHFLRAELQSLLQGQAPNQHRPFACFLTCLHEKMAGKCFPYIIPEFHSLCLQYAAKPDDFLAAWKRSHCHLHDCI